MTMKSQRRMLAVIAAAAGATLILAGCSGGAGTEGGSGDGKASETLTLTTIMPMTGPGSIYGEGVVKMLDLVIDQTNEAGGVTVGDTTYTLALDVLDDELNPETAQTVARQAVEDGAQIIIGPFGSGNASAVQPVMARGGAMWLLPIATVDGPTKNANVFRTAALVSAFIDPEVEFINAHDDFARIGLLTDQTHTAHFGSTQQLIDDLDGIGREVVASQNYSTGDTDFRAVLTQMLSENPDVMIVRGYTAESILVLQQLRELGYTGTVILNSGTTTAETESLVTDESLLENVYQSTPLTSLDPFVAEGNELAIGLLEDLGGKSGAADAYVYDGMQILLAALSNATGVDADAVIEAMSTLPAEAVAGKTLNTYSGQKDGLVFEDREVDLDGVIVEWVPGSGWTPLAN